MSELSIFEECAIKTTNIRDSTHVIKINGKTTYFKVSNPAVFWIKYAELYSDGLFISEVIKNPDSLHPICLDININLASPIEYDKKLDEVVAKIVSTLQSIINKFNNATDYELKTLVLTNHKRGVKDKDEGGNYYWNIRLLFPNFCISETAFSGKYIEKLNNLLEVEIPFETIFEDSSIVLAKEWKDTFGSFPRQSISIFDGSVHPIYIFDEMIDYTDYEEHLLEEFDASEDDDQYRIGIQRHFPIASHSHYSMIESYINQMGYSHEIRNRLICLIYSVYYNNTRPITSNSNIPKTLTNYTSSNGTLFQDTNSLVGEEHSFNGTNLSNISQNTQEYHKGFRDTLSNLEHAEKFCDMISLKRFTIKNTWQDIGAALFHIAIEETKEPNTLQGYNIWVNYSMKAKKFTEANCKDFYYKYLQEKNSVAPFTIRTLIYYAKQDSNSEFEEWHSKWINDAIEKCIVSSDLTVAAIFYRSNGSEYMHDQQGATARSEIWYKFNRYKWEIVSSLDIKRDIISRLTSLISYYSESLASLKRKTSGNDEKTKIEQKEKKMFELQKNLGKSSFVGNLYKAFAIGCDDGKVLQRYSDRRFNVTCCGNTVIEVNEEKIITRSGCPDDYCVKSTMNYPIGVNENSNCVKIYNRWLNQIFGGNKEVIHEFHKYISSLLFAGNRDRTINIFQGPSGRNGKSALISVIQRAFDEYIGDCSLNAMQHAIKNINSPSPTMADLAGTRLVIMSEEDRKTKLPNRIVKQITGNDRTERFRGLFEKGKSEVSTYKLAAICNDAPDYERPEEAVESRTRVWNFVSQFHTKDYPETEEEQYKTRVFKADPDFISKNINYLSTAMLFYAVHYWPIYYKEGAVGQPEEIRLSTERYWKRADMYRRFCAEMLDKTNSKSDFLTLRELYQQFIVWFNTTNNGVKYQNSQDSFKDYLKRFYSMDSDEKKFLNCKFKIVDQDM